MLQNLRLSRIPADDQLQAWNAADELLLNRQEEVQGNSLIVNDSFGAIALSLNNKQVSCWLDSATSAEALQHNANQNNLVAPPLVFPPFTDGQFETIVIHIPKSASYFSWLLETLKPSLTGNRTVLALGMTKHINNAHIKVMNEQFANVNPGRAEKKARVIRLTEPREPATTNKTNCYANPLTHEDITVLPGCFAEKSIDPGARVFISYFNQLPEAKKVLDLGCGNGVLTQTFLSVQPSSEVHLADDSRQAIDSAKLNLQGQHNCFFHHSNGLNNLKAENFDLILCNPPFHQNSTVTLTVAEKLISDAANVLSKEGQLWLVANRHLDYRKTLKEHFNTLNIVSKDARFNVICCTK
ncbi:class I SAM-dependent methyltransferase [Reinekea marinisedimentorum]|uniref:16S rRNA (Guanine1207-N2)-methyltransferase n=1 Tax=Reinekea marinisedimentorum TaxID=230495 RepID=A0A4R3I8K1_9GAMM|nr:class I SAM-dependent methyltransferase [Reinekea marinisedimentorum]TCS42593.1 16S rRNA (guanine1207-N2)-methyltransferase [Reinekea marinisedimentorum]